MDETPAPVDTEPTTWQEFKAKYFKPYSLAWWTAVLPLFLGVMLGLADATPLLGWLKQVVQMYYPGATPFVLINLGLFGIGLRGAHK